MNFILNNRSEEILQNTISIAELLVLKNYTFKMLVIKLNGVLIKKEFYGQTQVQEGDKLDILHLVSGG